MSFNINIYINISISDLRKGLPWLKKWGRVDSLDLFSICYKKGKKCRCLSLQWQHHFLLVLCEFWRGIHGVLLNVFSSGMLLMFLRARLEPRPANGVIHVFNPYYVQTKTSFWLKMVDIFFFTKSRSHNSLPTNQWNRSWFYGIENTRMLIYCLAIFKQAKP